MGDVPGLIATFVLNLRTRTPTCSRLGCLIGFGAWQHQTAPGAIVTCVARGRPLAPPDRRSGATDPRADGRRERRAFGVKSARTGEPADNETVFEAASTSKPVGHALARAERASVKCDESRNQGLTVMKRCVGFLTGFRSGREEFLAPRPAVGRWRCTTPESRLATGVRLTASA